MEALAMPVAGEATDVKQSSTPPRRFDEEEMDIVAFKLWQRASCPESASDQSAWSSAEEDAWCKASCL